MNKKIRTLDVFSGIGGVSRALSPFCSTVMYCETDKYCQAVLTERMETGDLDRAPIHSDIRTLHLPSQGMDVDMICGGFPCQDISCIGLQKGIVEGHRSSMFFEMMRVVDESPGIHMVFLENVGNIMLCGFADVMEALACRGFDMMWTTRAANVFGAPHCRNRWFCLAVKRGVDVDVHNHCNEHDEQEEAIEWYANEPEKRYTFKPSYSSHDADETFDPMWIHRCHTLGNTVVPCVVRSVFRELLECMSQRDKFSVCMAQYSRPLTACTVAAMPDHGMIVHDRFIQVPRHPKVTRPTSVKITIRQGDKLLKMDKYPTPRRGITHANTVTERTIRDLPTVLVNCEETLSHAQNHHETQTGVEEPPHNNNNTKQQQLQKKPMTYLLPNVEYIEWMMNFPRNWTRVDPSNLLYPKIRASSATAPKQATTDLISVTNNKTNNTAKPTVT